MTAKEMFVKIEYELSINDNKLIEYRKYYANGDYIYIRFYLNSKILEVGMNDKSSSGEELAEFIYLDMFEAITQQMKELGWL